MFCIPRRWLCAYSCWRNPVCLSRQPLRGWHLIPLSAGSPLLRSTSGYMLITTALVLGTLRVYHLMLMHSQWTDEHRHQPLEWISPFCPSLVYRLETCYKVILERFTGSQQAQPQKPSPPRSATQTRSRCPAGTACRDYQIPGGANPGSRRGFLRHFGSAPWWY